MTQHDQADQHITQYFFLLFMDEYEVYIIITVLMS